MTAGVAKMDHMGAGEVAGWLTAGGTTLLSLGAAIRWIVTWLSGRQDKRIADLEHQVVGLMRRLDRSEAKVLLLGQEIVMLIGEVPSTSPARERATNVLRQAFPINMNTPEDLLARARQLDG